MNTNNPYVVSYADLFNDDEVSEILRLTEFYALEKGVVVGEQNENKNITDNIRTSQIKWIPYNKETEWVYLKISNEVREINKERYHFQLTGTEPIQYSEYYGSNGGKYDFHLDTVLFDKGVRKISVSILLSSPDDYVGGDLITWSGPDFCIAERKKGRANIFPSWTLHKVNPVISGTRKSLVLWFYGEEFK
jgi:PKHD-type hydroxylase